jgi:hypothetical protein
VNSLFRPAYRGREDTAALFLILDHRYMLLVGLTLKSHLRERFPDTLSIGASRSGVFGDEINLLCRR